MNMFTRKNHGDTVFFVTRKRLYTDELVREFADAIEKHYGVERELTERHIKQMGFHFCVRNAEFTIDGDKAIIKGTYGYSGKVIIPKRNLVVIKL